MPHPSALGRSVKIQQQNQHHVPRMRSTKTRDVPTWARLIGVLLIGYVVFLLYWMTAVITAVSGVEEKEAVQKLPSLQHKHKHPIQQRHPASNTQPSKTTETNLYGSIASAELQKSPLSSQGRRLSSWWNRHQAEQMLKQLGADRMRQAIMAYIEPSLNDTTSTQQHGGNAFPQSQPTTPRYYKPLPVRTSSPNDLQRVTYSQVQTCHDMPAKLPVNGHPSVTNVGNDPTPDNFPLLELPHCPVEADPFLPWIHDVFPSVDGKHIHFVAQNKRRCRTGKDFQSNLERLEPQVALLQAVSVQRLDDTTARKLAPTVWQYPSDYLQHEDGDNQDDSSNRTMIPRYRLSSYDEASPDGQATRFICRFHGWNVTASNDGDDANSDNLRPPTPIVVGETLSVYPFNYELVNYRKTGWEGFPSPLLKRYGGRDDNKKFWTSTLMFSCPTPDTLVKSIASSDFVLSDGTPTLWVDVIPIRTTPRFGIVVPKKDGSQLETSGFYLTSRHIGPDLYEEQKSIMFDPHTAWGSHHVLPPVEASGRWANLPICYPPRVPPVTSTINDEDVDSENKQDVAGGTSKPHLLSACLWASAAYKTRGPGKAPTTDALSRLTEWIEFHLMVGFDHIYVYDNSGAGQTVEGNDVQQQPSGSEVNNLAPVTDRYPASQVTRIEWPSLVCNNNIPAHDNTGERSSQYAAENSCRSRAAPFTEWIATLDVDEYFVPMGTHTSLRPILRHAQRQGTNILSFRSTRGKLRYSASSEYRGGCMKLPNVTFLEAYNCDGSATPKPEWADRARKQVYRSEYVPYHFVHYSTVTKGYMESYEDHEQQLQSQGGKDQRKNRQPWSPIFQETEPSERVTDEVHEAVMIHAKTIEFDQTRNFKKRCHYGFKKKWLGCMMGYPWPSSNSTNTTHNQEGMEYNCFINDKLETYWIPKLVEALNAREFTKKKSLTSLK